ncbi:NUDIX hydrolase [Kitasatospora sp. McL0602]|uniref:NUDIX hydrolase n=1 Tax=Kitasatospora sp. McL0602 TaxID=3439530 RepID=UPI003F8AEA99
MDDEADQARITSRVLLLDGEGRLLLLKSHLDPADHGAGHCWMPPGGGVEPGESLAQAAARELAEETGLRVTPEQLGGPVALTSGYADLGWAAGVFTDHYFQHRVISHQVDISGQLTAEMSYYAGHRWWTRAELATGDETVHPYGLTELLRLLDTDGPPDIPVQLPWHH